VVSSDYSAGHLPHIFARDQWYPYPSISQVLVYPRTSRPKSTGISPALRSCGGDHPRSFFQLSVPGSWHPWLSVSFTLSQVFPRLILKGSTDPRLTPLDFLPFVHQTPVFIPPWSPQANSRKEFHDQVWKVFSTYDVVHWIPATGPLARFTNLSPQTFDLVVNLKCGLCSDKDILVLPWHYPKDSWPRNSLA
jgi:hypothetical protein